MGELTFFAVHIFQQKTCHKSPKHELGTKSCEDIARGQGYTEVAEWIALYEKWLTKKKKERVKKKQKATAGKKGDL